MLGQSRGKRHSSGVLMVLGVVWLTTVAGQSAACHYGSYGFTPGKQNETTVDGLFRGRYDDYKNFKTTDWIRELKERREEGIETSDELADRLDYAWLLHKSGDNRQSVGVLEAMLKAQPDQYEALCTYGTILHAMNQYDKAGEMLRRAVAIKPGWRGGAEELHLAMMDYQVKSRRSLEYAQANVFVDSLTPIWKNRGGVEENFSKVDFPEELSSQGMVELVREYPWWGDGWMGLGMLLEHEKDFSMAAKAYDKAIASGTAHVPELKRYMTTFRDFGRSMDPARVGGKRILQLGMIVIGLAVAWWIVRFLGGLLVTFSAARAVKENERRKKALRKFKDPDAPL